MQLHVRSRLTNVCSSTSSDIRYCAFFYDTIANVSQNHKDTCLVLKRGLIVGKDITGGLTLRGKVDSALSECVGNRQMNRKMCATQKYHNWSHFLTHTHAIKN